MSYRLPMPLAHVDQNVDVHSFTDALADLAKRVAWFLYTRSAVEAAEEYRDLGIYIWLEREVDGLVANMALSDDPHVRANFPDRFARVRFEGVWTIRGIENVIRSDEWLIVLQATGRERFLPEFIDA